MSADEKLSYLTHNGIELKLMLHRKKPMAFFMHPEAEKDWFIENVGFKFEKYIQSGKILKFSHKMKTLGVDSIIYAYTLPDEQWRADALFLLMESFSKCKSRLRWSEGLERMLGSLLGYEDWQNDEYVQKHISEYE